MKRLLHVVMLFVTTATLVIISSTSARAASAPSGANGYRLSPVRTDLTIDPGSSEVVTLYLDNASASIERVQTIVNDFEAPTNESGDPALLLNGASAPSHSLKQFVVLENPTFTLQPGQQQAINVVIKVPAGTASGGYYGAIRFAPAGAAQGKNVDLSASVASLVLITVPGNLDEQLSIAGFGVSQGSSNQTHELFFSNKNLQVITRFQNSGNVQEQPFGKILLKRGSTTLGSYVVNGSSSPGNVLPDSIRAFSGKIYKVGWFGKYKIEGSFGYGSKGQLLTAQSTFYVIPVLFIILAILAVLLILFLIFGLPRAIRAYNRRIIARSSRRQ
jgi:hypothetical protein